MNQLLAELRRRSSFILATTIVGGLGFTWVQGLVGQGNIADFLGAEITKQGGYPATLATPIGWTVHMAIAFSYALGFTTLLSLRCWPKSVAKRTAAMLASAIAVGWVTTWIANPAISFTVSALAGNGWPETIYPINWSLSVPLYNHFAFFTLTYVMAGLAPEYLATGTSSHLPKDRLESVRGLNPGHSVA